MQVNLNPKKKKQSSEFPSTETTPEAPESNETSAATEFCGSSTTAINPNAAKAPPVATRYALDYMTDFQCLMDDCPSTCCQGWGIPVNPQEYKVLEEKTKNHPIFDVHKSMRVLPKKEQNPRMLAMMKQAEDGKCILLSPTGLCTLHRDVGPEVLPRICHTFPRRRYQVGENTVLMGELSCPSVVQKVLDDPDAMMLRVLDETGPAEIPVSQVRAGADPTPYQRAHDLFREVGIFLLTQGEYQLNERLFFLLYFSQQVSTFLNRKTTENVDERLEAEVEKMTHKVVLDELARILREDEVAPSFPLSFVGHVLTHMDHTRNKEFFPLLKQALSSSIENDGNTDLDTFRFTPQVIGKILVEHNHQKLKVNAKDGGKLNDMRTRLLVHHWLERSYFHSKDLLTFVGEMIAEHSLFFFLVLNRPEQKQDLTLDDEAFQKVLRERMIQVTYLTARLLEHGYALDKAVQGAVAAEPKGAFAAYTSLIRF